MDIFVMFMDETYFKCAWMRKTCQFNTIKNHMDANILVIINAVQL